MKNAFTAVLSVVLATVAHTQSTIPPALHTMADTERAFAKRAQEVTVREAFIEFFADEAVGFEPEPVPARESLRKSTRQQPPGFRLLWEPRFGDIAASGDLGYLTGPSETIVPDQPTRHGNYFSVWKKQSDGQYRVILDIGGGTPQQVSYAPGFTRAPSSGGWSGRETRAESEKSLLAADQTFSTAIAQRGPATAYTEALHPNVFFQRLGFEPMRTRQAAVEWLAKQVKDWKTEPVKVETAASGDLGYSWGKYRVTPVDRAAYAGYYVRVWTRDSQGAWHVVAEVATPPPPAKPQSPDM
jgi:ketosteroid isomerase-like protein